MAFATTADVQARLVRALTIAEMDAAEFLLEAVQAEIEQHAATIEADFDNVPAIFRFVVVEAVCRELASPVGAESVAETLGSYSYRVGYRETGGTLLTRAEEMLVRRATAQLSGSTRVPSLVHDVYVTE